MYDLKDVFRIYIKRICDLKAPYDLCWETYSDWTHFMHLHRKSHAVWILLRKEDQEEIFYYKARWLYPFPWYDRYIVFRRYTKDRYLNLYFNLDDGRMHHLKAWAEKAGSRTRLIGELTFALPSFWRFFPRVFLWIFKFRMKRVMREDNDWIRGRMTRPHIPQEMCAPVIPPYYNLWEDFFKEEKLPQADIYFEDYAREDFSGAAV